MKKRVKQVLILLLTASMMITIACTPTTDTLPDATEMTSTSTKTINSEYLESLTEQIKSDIYGSLDEYVINTLTDYSVADYFTEDDITELTEQIIDTVETSEDVNIALSEENKEEIKGMITSAINEIDFTEMCAEATAELSEPTKAFITESVSREVANVIACTPFTASISNDDKAQIETDVINMVNANLPAIVNTAVSEVAANISNVSYQLTYDDVEMIKNAVLQSADIANVVQQYFSANYDETYFQSLVTTAITARVDELVASGLRGTDGYTPVKGQDYFTQDEINSIVNQVAASVQGGSAYTPVKGVDYFTQAEIDDIVNTVVGRVGTGGSGTNGTGGYTPVKGVDYFTDEEVNEIINEVASRVQNGSDGYTPVKGVDYFTDEEIAEIIAEATSQIHNGVDGADGYTPVKGVDYFTDDEIADLTTEIASVVETDLNDTITDIQTQINNTSATVTTMNGTVTDLQTRLADAEQKLADAAQNDSATNTELDALAEEITTISSDISALQQKAVELENNKLDVSTYNTYTANTTASIESLTQKDEELAASITALKNTMETTYATIETVDAKLADYATKDSYDAFTEAYDTFKTNTTNALSHLETTCTTLTNTKLNKADFETYQQEEAVALADLESAISDNTLLLGDIDFTTANYDTLTGAAKSLQEQLNTFYTEYGTALESVTDDISSINTVIGTKADGSVYTDYTGSLWQATAELYTALGELQTKEGADKAELTALITAVETALETHVTSSDASLQSIQTSISDINTELDTKLDATTFVAYQTTVDASLASLEGSVSSLEARLGLETQNRTDADNSLQDKIDKEVEDRGNADDILQSALDDEIEAREQTDSDLEALTQEVTSLQTAWNTFTENGTMTLAEVESAIINLEELSAIAYKPQKTTFTGNVDDLMMATSTGMYYVDSSATGIHPCTEGYYLSVMPKTDTSCIQTAYTYSDAKMYTRMYINGQWYPWTEYYTADEVDAFFDSVNTDLVTEKEIPITLGSSGISTYAGGMRLKGKRFISNYSFRTNTAYSSNTKLVLIRFNGVNIKSEKRFLVPCLDEDGFWVCNAVVVVGNGTITFLFSNNIASGTVVHVHIEFDIDY